MASVTCSYSGSAQTSWYDSSSGASISSTGVTYETTTGEISIKWKMCLEVYSSSRYNFIAGQGKVNGEEVCWDHADTWGTYWTWSSWSDGTTFKSGTYTCDAKSSVALWCKAMFDYGYTSGRWNDGTGCVSGSGTLKITLPTIGSPSVSVSVGSKSSASRGGDDGSAKLTPSASAGTNGGDVSYSVSCNGSSKSNGALSLTGLSNNVSYSWSASATNSAGKTGSNSGSFYLTPVAPATPTVSTTPSRTGCTFSVSSSYDNKRAYSSTSIKYGTSTSYGSTSSSTTLSGLSPNTTYYYSVTVTDKNNSGAYSTALTSSAKTGSFKTTCNKPSSLSMSRSSGTTTSITVKVSATGDTNAAITNYTLYYKKASASSYTSVSLGTSTSKTLSSLSVDTDYNFYFTATNAGGTTTSSTYTYSTTLNNPTITTPVVTNLLPFSCTVTATGSITPSRTLNYRFSKDGGTNWTSYQTSNTYNWTGLSEETTYTMAVQVRATKVGTNASNTTASSTVNITTPADQAKIRIKKDGNWVKGKTWLKKDGVWVKAKKIYIKVDGQWVIGYNYEN